LQKDLSNFCEINPQSTDGNFTKEPPNFVNINFTKYSMNFNEIDTHSTDCNFTKTPNFGETKKTPEL